ncbi:5-hydroxytryptamine receptor 2B [Aplysia californica]|uniref:5-hydroxytryptamine receptor 2B n=1 Tax=Aplysia californica TaxID=6500 RepID=A0ABM1ABJ3_APLCA|nr:5-hydroxytryptamine receptor 2B [Aplysia californica]
MHNNNRKCMDVLLFGKTPIGMGVAGHKEGDLELRPAMALDRDKRFVVTKALVEQSRILALFVIFILLIIVINTAIVVFIVASKAMRQSSRHILIVSVCLGDLLMGLFVLPALLDLGTRHGENIGDCSVFYAMRLFADFLIPSVTTLGMLALNIDYILRLCYSAYSEGATRTTLILVLFLTPWVVSCALLIPLYIDGLNATRGSYWWETCTITMGGHLTRTLLVVSFFPQAALLLIFNIAVSVLYLVRRESYSLDATGERIRAPVDICLASFTTILFYTPVFLLTVLTTEGYLGCVEEDECRALRDMATTVVWLFFTKSWFLPLAWFTCKDTRTCIRHIFSCC